MNVVADSWQSQTRSHVKVEAKATITNVQNADTALLNIAKLCRVNCVSESYKFCNFRHHACRSTKLLGSSREFPPLIPSPSTKLQNINQCLGPVGSEGVGMGFLAMSGPKNHPIPIPVQLLADRIPQADGILQDVARLNNAGMIHSTFEVIFLIHYISLHSLMSHAPFMLKPRRLLISS